VSLQGEDEDEDGKGDGRDEDGEVDAVQGVVG